MTNAPIPTNAILATTLEQLDIHFIAGQPNTRYEIVDSPVTLLRGLASSNEARMRLALIPLLLKCPKYALFVEEALPYSLPDSPTFFALLLHGCPTAPAEARSIISGVIR